MSNDVTILQKDITETVISKIDTLKDEGLTLPSDYNYTNALKSAFFKLNDMKMKDNNTPVLYGCTTNSIANTLLDMVVQGLSPAKNQCYFIARGNQLTLMRSYFGTQLVLKRLSHIKDIWANVIYDGDVFDYENDRGRDRFLRHETKFQNRDNEIVGAYAIIEMADGEQVLTVMTRNEINMAWGQSDAKKYQKPNDNKKTVHDKFPQEMAKRTVINRAAKNIINTAVEEHDRFIEAINNATENEYEDKRKDMGEIEEVQQEIDNNANKEDFDFEELTELVIKDVPSVLIEEMQKAAATGAFTAVDGSELIPRGQVVTAASEPIVIDEKPKQEPKEPVFVDRVRQAPKSKKMEMEF